MQAKALKISLIIVCVLAAVAVLVYLVLSNIERVETIESGIWSDEARENPYLAAERFLALYGIESESSNQLIDVKSLSTDKVLVIKNANDVVINSRVNDVVEWIERGGHVIVEAQLNDEEQSDILLSYFNVEKFTEEDTWIGDVNAEEIFGVDDFNEFETESDDTELQRVKRQAERDRRRRLRERQSFSRDFSANSFSFSENMKTLEDYSIPENTVLIDLEPTGYSFRADFTGSGSLYHPAMYREDKQYEGHKLNYWTESDIAVGYLQLQIGDGRLSVMADLNIWQSQQIGMFDHAYLLRALVAPSEHVIFLYGASVPGLMALIWNNYFELCIALIILSLAWVYYFSRRFGPILNSRAVARRSFKEHVLAVGDYFWRNKMPDELVESLREDIWLAMRKRYPGFDTFDGSVQLSKLAEITQQPEQALQGLMHGAAPADEIRFFHAVKTLQKIRKML